MWASPGNHDQVKKRGEGEDEGGCEGECEDKERGNTLNHLGVKEGEVVFVVQLHGGRSTAIELKTGL